ncbi:MAG: hypothetical protein HY305_00115 [Sphingobacteriales bacterium]|nr:hypothetical protein [Sphingobacteriales bacterium]
MNKTNRDLMVLFRNELMTPQAIEHEVELLHELLCEVEKTENVLISYELIDLDKFKLTNKPELLRKAFRTKELKPFTFLNNKN